MLINRVGGGVGSSPVPTDGKTHLIITLENTARNLVPLYWSQTVSNGVRIDWGDGSSSATFPGTGYLNTSHTYSTAGTYDITLEALSGSMGLGKNASGYCVFGPTGNYFEPYCNLLKSVYLGDNIMSITQYAFSQCISLTSINIPNYVTTVSDSAFYNCYALSHITLPNNISSIASNIFYGCYTLQNIIIPNSVGIIGNYSFANCYALASVTIPSSVGSMGSNVFQGCSSLTEMHVPIVTYIGNNTFSGCFGMKEYHFQSTTPPALGGASVFTGIADDCIIYVPIASVDAYKAANYWSTHAAKITGE